MSFAEDIIINMARINNSVEKMYENREKESALISLKSYRSDLNKLLKANKLADKDLSNAKKLMSEVDRYLLKSSNTTDLKEIQEFVQKIKRKIKK